MELHTTVSHAARLHKEFDRFSALVLQMTNARGAGSSHLPCSGDCDPCTRAHALIRRQDEVFVGMCDKAHKIEAEFKQFKSQATTIEEELLQIHRERFLRPMRPISAVDQTTRTSAATVRISETAADSSSTGQT